LTGGPATASINVAIVRSPSAPGTYTVAADCTGSLDFGPPAHFNYDLFFTSKATDIVMIPTGGRVPGALQGTAERLSR